jgi:hypothetical protein
MYRNMRSLLLAGLLAQGAGATAAAPAAFNPADATARPPSSRPSRDWRSSSGSAIAAALLRDLARRSRRNGRQRRIEARPTAGLARVVKRTP